MQAVEASPLENAAREYREEGYTGPVEVYSPEQAAAGRASFFQSVGREDGAPVPKSTPVTGFYHQYRWAWDLVTAPRLLDHVEAILGPDVVLWAMTFRYKPAHSGMAVPWHQDATYWPMKPRVNCTAWVSLSDAFPENGCMRIVPGTHKKWLDEEHKTLTDTPSLYTIGLSEELVDEDKVVTFPMKPGEALFFSEATIHSSGANTSDVPRVSFVLRFTTPEVQFDQEKVLKKTPHVRTIVVRGEDRLNLNLRLRGESPAA